MNRVKGFSFIELIVVIGIILVLAGLLMPSLVSARISVAMTVDRVDMRSLGLGLHLYAGDHDDTLPSAYQTSNHGRYLRNRGVWVPYDWAVPYDHLQVDRGLYAWPNSAESYIKDSRIFKTEIVPDFAFQYWVLTPRPGAKSPVRVGQSFNGLLSHWNLSAVSSSSHVPLLSQVFGGGNFHGFSYSTPALKCPIPGPCTYSSSSPSCSSATNGTVSTITFDDSIGQTVYRRQQLFLTTDLSARSFTISRADLNSQPTDPGNEFYSRYQRNDIPLTEWKDQYGCHSLRFRPDFEPTDLGFAFEGWTEGGAD